MVNLSRVHTLARHTQRNIYDAAIHGAVTSASNLPTVVIDEMLSKERGMLYCGKISIIAIEGMWDVVKLLKPLLLLK